MLETIMDSMINTTLHMIAWILIRALTFISARIPNWNNINFISLMYLMPYQVNSHFLKWKKRPNECVIAVKFKLFIHFSSLSQINPFPSLYVTWWNRWKRRCEKWAKVPPRTTFVQNALLFFIRNTLGTWIKFNPFNIYLLYAIKLIHI